MPFSSDSDVEVKEISDKEWAVLRPIEYQGKQDPFVVPMGQCTDFASVPRVFAWFIPSYGRYTMPAILHDYLWRTGVPEGMLKWPDADAILRRALRECGVSFLRRWIMWSAVRLASVKKKGGRNGWLAASWPAILIAVPTLAIVLPPAVIILIALSVFYVIELIFWIPLKLTHVVRTRAGRPSQKQVNMPKFSWRL
jgi:hypothetical protein